MRFKATLREIHHDFAAEFRLRDGFLGSTGCRSKLFINTSVEKLTATLMRPGTLSEISRLKICRSYLVDPASSHMLVSKIKPCKCKLERLVSRSCEWLIKSVVIYLIVHVYLDNCGNSRANTCKKRRPRGRRAFIRPKTDRASACLIGDSG